MTDENDTTPMRAVVIVAYLHSSIGDEKVRNARDIMVDALMEDGPDWVDDGVQMLVSQIVPLDADESIEWLVDDMDDMDDMDSYDMDDFRIDHRHGSTPR